MTPISPYFKSPVYHKVNYSQSLVLFQLPSRGQMPLDYSPKPAAPTTISSSAMAFVPCLSILLKQWFSPFLMLQPFNTIPHVVATPTINLFWLLVYNCNFPTVVNCNFCVFPWS